MVGEVRTGDDDARRLRAIIKDTNGGTDTKGYGRKDLTWQEGFEVAETPKYFQTLISPARREERVRAFITGLNKEADGGLEGCCMSADDAWEESTTRTRFGQRLYIVVHELLKLLPRVRSGESKI